MSSMFSGIQNQITGLASKFGNKGEGAPGENPEEQAAAAATTANPNTAGNLAENGEELMGEEAQQAGGGVSGLAQGLLQKAMSAKEGFKEKASSFQASSLQGFGNNLMQGVSNLIPGRREEEVPTPPEPNPPSEIGGEVMEGDQHHVQE